MYVLTYYLTYFDFSLLKSVLMYFSFFLKFKQKYDENVDFLLFFLRKKPLINKCVNLKKKSN